MKTSSLLGHTFELFELTQRDRLPADQVANRFFRSRRYLGSRDRRFISEAVYGMLRHKLRIEELFRRALKGVQENGTREEERFPVGLYAAYLLTVEGKDPTSVCDTLGSFWNVHFPRISLDRVAEGILQLGDLDSKVESEVERLSLNYSFPRWVVQEWLVQFGESETDALCAGLNYPAPTTIRVNTLKTTVEQCRKRLQNEGIETIQPNLSPFGLVLPKRINIPSVQSFKEGWFELQDEASQIIPLLVNPEPGETIIDACAGGGGKTLELAALMKNKGRIIAVDVDEHRLKNLQRRVERAGVQNVEVRLAEKSRGTLPLDGLESVDKVLIDAPCSGLGTLRRNPGNKWKVSRGFVERISAQQRRLLDRWADVVREGGKLVYATCTLLRQENEAVVESFLGSHNEFRLVSPYDVLRKAGIDSLGSGEYLHLFPHRHGTDGFFAAVMVRSD